MRGKIKKQIRKLAEEICNLFAKKPIPTVSKIERILLNEEEMHSIRIVKRWCISCKHWQAWAGWWGSDVTPGDDAEMSCALNKWGPINLMHCDTKDYRERMKAAETCEEYLYFDD